MDPESLIGDPEALYEDAPCGYLAVHPDGRILRANRTFLAWTGYTPVELDEREFVDLLAPGARIFHETHYLPLLHLQGHVEELTLDLVRSDGSRLPALVNAVLDRTAEGEPSVVRVAVFDATERRRYERELLEARRRAEESEEAATRIARTLQQTLMPPRRPRIPGLDVATAFRPAGTGAEIGGDFYDVFELGDQDWVVIVGDVAGKGVEAAVVANLARYTIRALSVTETSPAEVLSQLNQVVYRDASGRFLTVVVLRMRRTGDLWDVTMALGGHPSPLVLNGTDEPYDMAQPSFLVGAFDTATYEDVRFELRPGTTVLLHTDGVSEARRGEDVYGDERLRRFLHENIDRPEALLGHLLEEILEFQGDSPKDDIALVALQVPADHHQP